MSRIFVVDDEPKSVKLLRLRLEEMGHVLSSAGTLTEAKSKLCGELFDLLITDVRLPDGLGIELVSFAKKQNPAMPVIVITAYGTIQDAVDAMQAGATDFVQKPFELEAMALLVGRALDSARIRAEHSYLVKQLQGGEKEVTLVGHSPLMQKVRELVDKVAATSSLVLLLGESGTGKELVAQTIHKQSSQKAHPLIKVNCPGIPTQLFESELFGHMKGSFTGAFETRKGKFELAGKGNILLDEISEIPFELQAKLLRVIEERKFTRVGGTGEISVEARIIVATNRDLPAMVKEGRFREDLFYRLNVFPIELPPLRNRREDVPLTTRYLLDRITYTCGLGTDGISDDAVQALVGYNWPGNVRELRNILERALVLAGGEKIEMEHLPLEIQEGGPDVWDRDDFSGKVESYKKSLLLEALRSTGWSKKNASETLGLSQRAFSHYVSKYKLDDHRF
jgi:DNA-binding NtrC family response regulator